MGLFAMLEEDDQVSAVPIPKLPELDKAELMTMEKETTGLYLSGHPMDQYRETVRRLRAPTIASILEDFSQEGGPTRFADGQRITIRELRTSAIVTGGVATFDIQDHIWYDDYDDFLQDTMTVTLTPYVITDSGKQKPLDPIHYDIDIPLSPIDLSSKVLMANNIANKLQYL